MRFSFRSLSFPLQAGFVRLGGCDLPTYARQTSFVGRLRNVFDRVNTGLFAADYFTRYPDRAGANAFNNGLDAALSQAVSMGRPGEKDLCDFDNSDFPAKVRPLSPKNSRRLSSNMGRIIRSMGME